MRRIYESGRSNVLANNAMVATSQPLSSQEAINILKIGGNAVDAAIAASAVLSVTEPGSTGIGGDCFAIVKMENKKPISINGSGINPKNANLNYFKKNKIDSIGLLSPHSVTIPGAVDAWFEMHKRFGKLDFEQLLITAENYARNGFPVHEIEAYHWKKNEDKLKKNKITKNEFLINNKAPKFASKYRNIKLADTLNIIGRKGAKGFYEGDIAKDMVNSLNHLGGTHTEEDFYNQKTIFSDTLISKYKENFISTLNLLEHSRQKGIKKFVYLSSYVYGKPTYLPINEDHPLNINNPYGRSKLLCESLCKSYAEDFGMNIIIVRPFNVYGWGQDSRFLLPTIINQAMDIHSDKIMLHDLKPKRDFLYIKDLVIILDKISLNILFFFFCFFILFRT